MRPKAFRSSRRSPPTCGPPTNSWWRRVTTSTWLGSEESDTSDTSDSASRIRGVRRVRLLTLTSLQRLDAVELGVQAAVGNQRVVGAVLDHLRAVDHEDDVG